MTLHRNLTPISICAVACALMVVLFGLVGCRATQRGPKLLSFAAPAELGIDQANTPVRHSELRQVAFQTEEDNDVAPVGLIPLSIESDISNRWVETAAPEFGGNVTLNELEQLLLSRHPEILKAESQISGLTGKKLQAGLPPNPNVGIIADDINANDGFGRYGVFYGQKVVRGGKLGLAQSVVCSELDVANNRLDAIKQRLLIDLRQRYYEVLLAQESVRQTRELADVLEKSVDTSEKLFAAEEIAKAPVLRSQVEFQNASMMVRQAANRRTATIRSLAALIGESEMRLESLAGDVRDVPPMEDFETAFDQMLENHPELSATFAGIEQARRELAQQTAVPIPDVTWQTSLQYDFTVDEIVGGFQIGLPLPKYNRNQGAIFQAQQNVQSSINAADQKVLELRDRLTTAWANYVDARIQLESLDAQLLPKAAKVLELANEGYRQGETPYLELLSAQQLFAKTKLGYIQKLRQRWQYHVEIRGLIANFSETSCN